MLNTYRKLLQDTTAFMQESAAGSFVFGLSSETSLSSTQQLPVEKERIIAPPKEVKFERHKTPVIESKPVEVIPTPAPKPQSKEAPKSPPLEIQRTLQKIAPRL